MNLPVYLDHAATTPVAPEVREAMAPYLSDLPWNASAIHSGGRMAHDAVERARTQVAALIGAAPDEVYFTSGGTEANNWALKAVPHAPMAQHPGLLVSAVEHAAVLEAAGALAREGWDVGRLPVTAGGHVEPDHVEKRITARTALVSVMMVNNEVGVIQPVSRIAEVCRSRQVVLHVDAVQALGLLPVNVDELGADLLTISAHKIHGPKGVGALYIRRGVHMGRWMDGGSQERAMRAGTVNVPGIVGFGAACSLVAARRAEDAQRLETMRDRFAQRVLGRVRNARLTGGSSPRAPHIVNLCFRDVESEAILIGLDAAGVYASGGAACSAGSVTTSHVLQAMGVTDEWARGAVRFSLGRNTTEDDLDYAASALEQSLREARVL